MGVNGPAPTRPTFCPACGTASNATRNHNCSRCIGGRVSFWTRLRKVIDDFCGTPLWTEPPRVRIYPRGEGWYRQIWTPYGGWSKPSPHAMPK